MKKRVLSQAPTLYHLHGMLINFGLTALSVGLMAGHVRNIAYCMSNKDAKPD